METLAFLYAAVDYEAPGSPPTLRSFENWQGSIPPSVVVSALTIGLVAASFNQADSAQALIRRGDRGPGVRQLQEQLGVAADGVYGQETMQAVRSFQQDRQLQVDGIAGPATLSALGLPKTLTATGTGVAKNTVPAKNTVAAKSRIERPISTTASNPNATYVTAAVLNVRAYPSVNAPVTAMLYQGAQVGLTGATQARDGYQWSQLSSGGWVASQYLSSTGTGSDGSNGGGGATVPVAGTAYVSANRGLLVRNSPGGTVVGSLGYGTPIALTGSRQYANNRYWVQLASGTWVAEEFVVYQKSQLG